MTQDLTTLAPEQIKLVKKSKIPEHVAFIPDGNRRWAKANFILPEQGHKKGADSLMDIVLSGEALGIKTLTFYIFSTENWSRPKREINAQMRLLERYLIEQTDRMVRNGVCFHTIGDLTPFSDHIHDLLAKTKKATAQCNRINVIFAMNYGGRSEICRAVQRLINKSQSESTPLNQVTEEMISNHLDTAAFGDPDLLIRTSGESRISNFLLWQLSYTEIYLTETYWPDFTPEMLAHAIIDYQKRDRRRGGGT